MTKGKTSKKKQTFTEQYRELCENTSQSDIAKLLKEHCENGIKELISTAISQVKDPIIIEKLALILMDSREFKIYLLGIRNKHVLKNDKLITDILDVFNIKYFIKSIELPLAMVMPIALQKVSEIMCVNLMMNEILFFEELAKTMKREKLITPSKTKTAKILGMILGKNESELSRIRELLAPSKTVNAKKIAEKHPDYEWLKK